MTRIGSLFSGYGGLELGVQAALGGTTAWVSDIDKGACKILAHRYPDVPNLGDISTVDWSAVEPVDVLTGGFPCQDVSHAGKRAGLRPDTRTGLWSQMAYAIDQLRPALVVAENVRGLLSAEAHSDLEPCPWCMGDGEGLSPLRALGAVLGDLADIGYDACWYGLRAADVGAAHGRFRVFVVAYPQRRGWDGWAPDSVRGSVGRVAFAWGGEGPCLLPTPAVNDMGAAYTPDEWDAWTDRMKAEHGNGNGHGKSLSIEAARLLPTPRASEIRTGPGAALRADSRSAPSLEQATEIAAGVLPREFDTWEELPGSWQNANRATEWGAYADAITRWEHVLGRPAPAPTMTSAKGNPQLAPAFVEWLMGLPAGWVTEAPGITRNEALKALGNGVVPAQAEAAIRYLLGAMEMAA